MTRSGPLYLLGQSNLPSQKRTYAGDVSYNKTAQNDVQVWFDDANIGNNLYSDNAYTGVLTIGPTLNATLTGSGPTGFAVPEGTPFGSRDFRAYNIDFRNEFAPYSDGPAHALGVSRANSGFYSCGFYSWQDTVSLFTFYFSGDFILKSLILHPDIRRKTRQCILLRYSSCRTDRFSLRLRHPIHHKVHAFPPTLWRRCYSLEGHEYHLREQVRCVCRLLAAHRE